MFSRKCFCKSNISQIGRPVLAALSVNGLIGMLRDLVVHGVHWLPRVRLQVRVSTGFAQAGCPDVWRCVKLSMVLLQLRYPLKHFVRRRKLLPGSEFLSRFDMTFAVEIGVKQILLFLASTLVLSMLPNCPHIKES